MARKMTKAHAIGATAPAKYEPPTYAYVETRARNWLEDLRDRGLEAAAEFSKKLSVSLSEAQYAMEWAGGRVDVIVRGRLAEVVLAASDAHPEIGLEGVLKFHVEQYSRALLGDHYSGNSTSAYANALESAKRDAARHFCDTFGGAPNFLHSFAEARAMEYLL